MYRPPAFREDRRDVLIETIRAHPLATLITAGEGGIVTSMMPIVVRGTADAIVLAGHLAKANGQLVDLAAGAPTSLLFHGPQAYVTPAWYPTKKDTGRVVPTWNYSVVQAWATPVLHHHPDWVRAQVDELTRQMEQPRPLPWAVADAPSDYLAGQIKGIVGVELRVARIEGKAKLSQNQPEANRRGVIEGLEADGQRAMADAIRRIEPD